MLVDGDSCERVEAYRVVIASSAESCRVLLKKTMEQAASSACDSGAAVWSHVDSMPDLLLDFGEDEPGSYSGALAGEDSILDAPIANLAGTDAVVDAVNTSEASDNSPGSGCDSAPPVGAHNASVLADGNGSATAEDLRSDAHAQAVTMAFTMKTPQPWIKLLKDFPNQGDQAVQYLYNEQTLEYVALSADKASDTQTPACPMGGFSFDSPDTHMGSASIQFVFVMMQTWLWFPGTFAIIQFWMPPIV